MMENVGTGDLARPSLGIESWPVPLQPFFRERPKNGSAYSHHHCKTQH